MKILLLVLAAYLVYVIFFKKSKILQGTKDQTSRKDNSTAVQANDMVECPTCGTYVSIDDAIMSNGGYFCSKECIR